MIYASLSFWKGAAERAIATGAQFCLLVLGVGVGAGALPGETAQIVNALTLNYVTLGGAFLGGALVSVLTSLARPDFVAGAPGASPVPLARH
ncbi:hypothetical protein [Antribacter gilvus]|uniref:hypothetical protein n=1 Tax=Antribacter gilvus TaxID=2304675 RepID=UPI000F7A328F|nr:hypothetical protein [Antribacter gilvus]